MDLTETVAKHYNELQEGGLQDRVKSRIFYQRNFNNWIKSMAISDALSRVKDTKSCSRQSIAVLDLCSGKGGDLLKWKKGDIDYLVCADIAQTSVEQCESRYKEMLERTKHERGSQRTFRAKFITADCTKQRLKDMYDDRDQQFDIVSCQFSFHYSFESQRQAEVMLQNACECIKPGGFFIGTIPDAYQLVKRLRSADGLSFGNEVYRITFDTADKQDIALFGAKYHFNLEGVVDCPEFVVYFPLLEKMAAKYDMKLIYRMPFSEFFNQKIQNHDGRGLIGRMQGLEPYPPDEDVELMSSNETSYSHVKKAAEQMQEKWNEQTSSGGYGRSAKHLKLGTLSQPEWEASTIYLVFAFQRGSSSSSGNSSRKRKHEDDCPADDSS